MIDLNKQYQTQDGKRVELHEIVLKNSCGRNVTYPVKGSIFLREKPRKTKYMIWSIDGIVDVVFGNSSEWNLMEK